jgi:glycerol kinase
MSDYMIGIDQSTTTTKAIIFNKNADVVARCDVNHKQIHPRQGWVEHDPVEIYNNLVKAVKDVIKKAGLCPNDIAGISVTNQRETTMMWSQDGQPIYNAIVWQCPRAAEIVERAEIKENSEYIRKATGLQLSPYFSAAKAAWIKENVNFTGEILFGTMDCWVIWKLTGHHATDCSNASRTQLFNIHEMKWDRKIINMFGLSDIIFPEVLPADAIYGETTLEGFFESPIPVAGVMGDSHGALFAQQCWESGMGKCTFGTGGSIMMNIGTYPSESQNKLNTSVAWNLSGKTEYVFEGTIVCQGDIVKWLVNEMKLIKNSQESEEVATSIDSSEGVYIVPAFSGLGAPYWKSDCRALICGLHRYAGREHIVRAALESIIYQIKDIIDPMMLDANINLQELKVDGGPTNNKFLMQFAADILGVKIITNRVEELSALGAVYAGGLALGFWKSKEEIAGLRKEAKIYRKEMEDIAAQELYQGWKNAVSMITS